VGVVARRGLGSLICSIKFNAWVQVVVVESMIGSVCDDVPG
jgi:hypothetical protein